VNVFLWIVQILLALAFLGAGLMKATRPKSTLQSQMAWVDSFSDGQVKAIGAVEVLGALGLVLPWATGIATVLTPLAAVGLMIVMVGAAVTHLRRKEAKLLPVPAVLFVLAAIVAIGRF